MNNIQQQSGKVKIMIVSFVAWTLTNMDQAFFGYALPGILQEFDLPFEAAGIILSVSFVVASILLVFTGIAADKYGRGPVLSILLAFSALLVGLQGVAGGVVLLTIFRALGFGLSSGLAPITNAYVAESVDARFRGLAMGALQCGYPLGWFIASLIAVPLLVNYGWRVMFFAAFGVIPLALLFYFLLRDTPLSVTASIPSEGTPGKGRLGELFTSAYRKSALASIVAYFAFGGAYAGTAFYFPTFFVETRGYSQADAASLVGMSNGIGIAGYLLAAYVGEYFITRRNVFIFWVSGGVLALIGLLWFSSNQTSDMVWYGLTAALFYGSLAVLPVLVAEIFPHHIRATGLAVCSSAPLSVGFAVFPFVVPVVVGQIGWQMGFSALVIPLLLVAAISACFLPNLKSGEALR